jgi:hypothetical protein
LSSRLCPLRNVWHKLEPLIVQDHRFLHERAEPCLFGGGQLLQREARSRKMWRLRRVMLLRATAESRPAMPAQRKEKVLTPSSRPDCFANSNPGVVCESEWRRDLNFFGWLALGNAAA